MVYINPFLQFFIGKSAAWGRGACKEENGRMETSKNKDDLTVRYAFIQCFFWKLFGGAIGFVSVYLLDCGFTNTQIGMIMAVAGLFSAIFQTLIAG